MLRKTSTNTDNVNAITPSMIASRMRVGIGAALTVSGLLSKAATSGFGDASIAAERRAGKISEVRNSGVTEELSARKSITIEPLLTPSTVTRNLRE